MITKSVIWQLIWQTNFYKKAHLLHFQIQHLTTSGEIKLRNLIITFIIKPQLHST
jgi:hypothetical protein